MHPKPSQLQEVRAVKLMEWENGRYRYLKNCV